jgi:hypothetical protein
VSNEKRAETKKEGVTRNHGFPYRKEGRDSLLGSTVETPQARRLPAWGFPHRKSDGQGIGGSLKEYL